MLRVFRTGIDVLAPLCVPPPSATIPRMRRLAPLLLLPLVLATGCTSHSSRCVNGTCSISLSGEQSVDVEFGGLERTLRVAPIEPTAVTLSARGDSARVPTGQTAEVGGLAVQVVSIAGRDVQLTVSSA
jgi:hypothetical protein